jgi:hypothetical protein
MLMQESGYRLTARNIKCGISITTGEQDCVAVDFGIGQINHLTIKGYKFNLKKLMTDLEYSVEASAIVLSDFKKQFGHKDDEYWTMYNTGVRDTPTTRKNRTAYKNLVSRYF